MLQEQDALIAEMRASVEQPRVQQRQSSIDSCRSSDDDDMVHADTLDRAVARNIDIDSAMIEQALNGISEPLSVSIFITFTCVMAIGADFKMYPLRQFCPNRVEFFLQYTGDTDTNKKASIVSRR